jgi:formylglycine-generating enzyme required for sulfatase activity
MKVHTCSIAIAVVFAAFNAAIQSPAKADDFGSGANAFSIDFVQISNTNNAANTNGYGAVPYEYRMGVYEISQANITKATASGLANVTAGAWTGDQPAANITWYEAAAFVNWMNTSKGLQAAYNLSWSGSAWSMSLWSSTDAWTLGGTNLFRHKEAYYFLPSENEWYKAAYYNPAGTNYSLYPTASSTAPTAVASGTDANTAVYNSVASSPAAVTNAGGLSFYGTMGQGGNVAEFTESAFDGNNSSPTESRAFRGGRYNAIASDMANTSRGQIAPNLQINTYGFHVASIPEPSTYALLLMAGAGALYALKRRKSSNKD